MPRPTAAAAAPSPANKPILSAKVLAPERPYADIDDVRHDFRLLQEFGAIEHQEFDAKSKRYDQLWSKTVADDDGESRPQPLERGEANEMETLLDWLFDRVLVDPAGLRAQLSEHLSGALKREVVLSFTNAPQLMRLMALQAEAEREQERADAKAAKKARGSSTTAS